MGASPKLDLATISFNVSWTIVYQIRLLQKYLTDDYELTVYDNSTLPFATEIERACNEFGVRYVLIPDQGETRVLKSYTTQTHDWGLRHACDDLLYNRDAPYIGFLDHDILPFRETSLIKLAGPGFWGMGQHHGPSGKNYLWPGLMIFSREWLGGRRPDFRGIPNVNKRLEGDTGSLLSDLFRDDEWERLVNVEHGYLEVRPEDNVGTQSWAVEQMGDWMHLGNVSNWMPVPKPEERTELLQRMAEGFWTQ